MVILEQSLHDRELDLQRELELKRHSLTKVPEKSNSSVSDLLLSAQQLKGSNERMCRLIETELEIRSVARIPSSHTIMNLMSQHHY